MPLSETLILSFVIITVRVMKFLQPVLSWIPNESTAPTLLRNYQAVV